MDISISIIGSTDTEDIICISSSGSDPLAELYLYDSDLIVLMDSEGNILIDSSDPLLDDNNMYLYDDNNELLTIY